MMIAQFLKYFYDIHADCPYGMPHTAVYRQAVFGMMPDYILERFFADGYRRNGNCLYTMACPSCRACVPIRLKPSEFKPNRNQRRVFIRNQDVKAEVSNLQMTDRNLRLLNKFLRIRYWKQSELAEEYYAGFFLNTVNNSFEVRYHVGDRLIGVAIIDLGKSWLNCVYFYFDPDEGKRSPGTFNILYLINFCKRQKIDFIYLGYWIKKVRAMSYKTNFKPHYLLVNGNWIQKD